MNIPLVDLKRQYQAIKDEIDKAIRDVIDKCAFIKGPIVKEFENNFANFCKAKYCVGVSNGTDAVSLALDACGIKQGDEVITAANTFIATIDPALIKGIKVKLVDIDKDTYLLDVNKLEENITKNTKAIIPVHLYGQMADMKPLMELAEKHELKIIEDAAQSHGAEQHGKRGVIGDVATYSFFPAKNLGAYGDAGAVVTDNEEIAEKLEMLRDHGRKIGEKYDSAILGYNHRLDGLQAAILNVKLKYLEGWTENRIKNAAYYGEFLKGSDVVAPVVKEYNRHVYHLYVIRTKKRDELQKYLKEKGVSSGIHYPVPSHLQQAFKYLNLHEGSFPLTEQYSKEILSLPMFPELTKEEIEYIAENVLGFFK